MPHYADAAEFYDLLYQGEKDYAAEAELLTRLICERAPAAATLLDVGCGTGSHARALLDAGFTVDGIDLEPAFVELARAKCPEGTFHVGDMTALDLPGRYDVVTCLFSAIGYVESGTALRQAIAGMARHLNPGGVLVVDPWFEPGQLTDGWITVLVGRGPEVTVCRMSRTVLEGTVSRLEFEYLIGRPSGIERRRETHALTLFTQSQLEAAFAAAGLRVTRIPEVLRTRGLYVAQPEAG
jgi:SAM-dependent methyltransferase